MKLKGKDEPHKRGLQHIWCSLSFKDYADLPRFPRNSKFWD